MQVTFPESPNAELLKRIAHAVDGVRTGEEIFLVVETQPPHRVVMVTTDEPKAEAKAEQATTTERSYVKVGPFRTKTDREGLPRFTLLGHGPDSDPENGEENGQRRVTDCYFLRTADFESPEGVVKLPKRAIELTDKAPGPIRVVEKIHVTWTYREYDGQGTAMGSGEGGPAVFAWKPEAGTERPMVDCLFFSVAAAEMLLYPYLAHVHGSEHAAKEMAATLNQI